MSKKIVVLGAGRVGAAMARDLASHHQVTVWDRDDASLESVKPDVAAVAREDLTQFEALKQAVKNFDLVVGAVPGFMGYNVFKTVIEAGVNIVDISFFPEDPLPLNDLAQSKGVVAAMDCGVAPGLCNMWLGDVLRENAVNSYVCAVGGLPLKPKPPWFYKAPFSPVDVIEEYTRPARLKEKGEIVTRPALSNPEMMDFTCGQLEAFETDGLRSLLFTVDVPDMKEMTLRWPRHRDNIVLLRDMGLFASDVVKLRSGVEASPLEVTAAALVRDWQYEPGEREFTVMRVLMKMQDGKTLTCDLYDEMDAQGISSMARTTGYTGTAVCDLVLKGDLTTPGVITPEAIGLAGHLPAIQDYLSERQVCWTCS